MRMETKTFVADDDPTPPPDAPRSRVIIDKAEDEPTPLPDAVRLLERTWLTADEPVPADAEPERITVNSFTAVDVPVPLPVAVFGTVLNPVAVAEPEPEPVAERMMVNS